MRAGESTRNGARTLRIQNCAVNDFVPQSSTRHADEKGDAMYNLAMSFWSHIDEFVGLPVDDHDAHVGPRDRNRICPRLLVRHLAVSE